MFITSVGDCLPKFRPTTHNSQPRYKITSLIKVTGHVDIRYAIYTISTAVHATQPQIS